MYRVILSLCVGWLAGCAHQSPAPHGSPPSDDLRFEAVTGHVWMHISFKEMGKWGLVRSNGLVVDAPQGVVLVDTAWTDGQTRQILHWVAATLDKPVVAAVVTHAHEDKMGGVGALRAAGVPVYAHPLSNRWAPERGLVAGDRFLSFGADGNLMAPVPELSGLTVFFPGAGHTHENLVVGIPEVGVVFGGCLIRPGASKSMGNTADGDVTTWAQSTRNVATRFPRATIVIPSHGAPGDRSLFDHTIELAKRAANKAQR